MSREQPVTFVRPGQGDLVEVLPDLPRECPQIVEPAGAAQQLLVVAASADRCSVLAGDLVADLAIVFDCGPDADVDRGQHGALSNHCKTSACSTPKHPFEIPHPLGDRVIGEHAAERCGDGDSRRWLIGHRRRIRVQQNLWNRRKLPEQAKERYQLDRGRLSDCAFEAAALRSRLCP
jgi:hypothetical protein